MLDVRTITYLLPACEEVYIYNPFLNVRASRSLTSQFLKQVSNIE